MVPPKDHSGARQTKPEPALPLGVRTRQMLADLAATARLVWSASPGLFSLILCLSTLLALVPAATLVGRQAARRRSGARDLRSDCQSADVAYRQLAMLLALQVGIAIVASLVQTHLRRVARAAGRHAAEPHQPADPAQGRGARRRELRERRNLRRAAQRLQRGRLAPAGRHVPDDRDRPGADHAGVDRRPDGAARLAGAAARAAREHPRRHRLEPLRRRRLPA